MQSALILGASSGIAQAFGRLLAERGVTLYLLARDPRKLEAVSADLSARGASLAGTEVLDLNLHAEHAAMLERAWAALGQVDLVLVAHGMLGDQAACEADPALALELMRTNYAATGVLLLHLATRLEAQGRGQLAVLSSVAGERGRRSNYIYGSSKAGLSALLSGLRARLAPAGVQVVTVLPGPVRTAMLAGRPLPPLTVEPELVARQLLRGLERGAHTLWLPPKWRAIMAVIRALPEAIFMKLKF
ncbi:MAG: SDR family oxidoreductase [Candidatus Cloacimonetes bacterium]|nr:SDR family oxidoreductase [Candidatus Cloacimonadota bacterium]